MRVSVNADDVAARFEGGTARLPRRIAALRALARAGYRVGLTIAPIMPIPEWRDGYGALLRDVADAVADVPDVDLTVECITHRFTEKSKDVLLGWYPNTKLDMSESARTRKFGKYGSAKYVYPEADHGRAAVLVRRRTRGRPSPPRAACTGPDARRPGIAGVAP